MNDFHTLTDCEGVELQSNVPFRFACCDCGLVHDMVIVSQDDKPVGFAIKRLPEATQERRAAVGIDFEHWLYHEQTEHDVDDLNKAAIELARKAFSAGLRKSPSAPGDAQDERQAFEAWANKKKMPLARIGEQYDDFWVDHAWKGWQARAALAAPAAGDALDARRYRWLRDQTETDGIAIVMKDKHFDESSTCAENIDKFIDAALAAQVPQQGEA